MANVYYVFCRKSTSKYSWIARKDYKHCYALVYDGSVMIKMSPIGEYVDVNYIAASPDSMTGMVRRLAKLPEVTKIVGCEVAPMLAKDTQPFVAVGLTCSEQTRRSTGIDIPWSPTPHSLLQNILKYDTCTNYNIFWES